MTDISGKTPAASLRCRRSRGTRREQRAALLVCAAFQVDHVSDSDAGGRGHLRGFQRCPSRFFPTTNFPRIIIGVDNGVMPIDQMEVTITRPDRGGRQQRSGPGGRALDYQPGLGGSGSFLQLERGHGDHPPAGQFRAGSRFRPALPPTAQIETNRLDFASFPILGYSLTSDRVSQSELWELATYDIKPRLNRLDGVASISGAGRRSSRNFTSFRTPPRCCAPRCACRTFWTR